MAFASERQSPVGIAAPRYRLPATARPGRVRLQISNLTRSLSFYEETLGFRVLFRTDERVELGAREEGGTLVELVEKPGIRPVSRRGRLGLFHAAFRLPGRADLARFVRNLRENSIRAGMSDHLVSEAVYLNDPDGLGVEIYADRPRESWRTDEEGQIVMATESLDTTNLGRAAGETSWTAMPAGTVVGHVHLHVGDLEQASAFYHEALGFDKTVWDYPGALFLSAGGYHHHLGTNTWAQDAPPPTEKDARLLEWTLFMPAAEEVGAAARSLEEAGYPAVREGDDLLTRDPWGTSLRVTAGRPAGD